MTASPTDHASEPSLPLTGERTIPGLDIENYWFRRHEVVYQQLAYRCTDRDVLEAAHGAALVFGDRHQVCLRISLEPLYHLRAQLHVVGVRGGGGDEARERQREVIAVAVKDVDRVVAKGIVQLPQDGKRAAFALCDHVRPDAGFA